MKKYWCLLVLLCLFPIIISTAGCEGDNITVDPYQEPPSVYITYPRDGVRVSEVVEVIAMATDDKSVENVTLWVDGVPMPAPGGIDDTEPYRLYWNTLGYAYESRHMIIVRATDNRGSKTDSEPIIVTVDNSHAQPDPIAISSIVYADDSYYIEWFSSIDGDFGCYTLMESQDREMTGAVEVYHTCEVTDTTFRVTGIPDDDLRYYQVVVADTLGFTATGRAAVATSGTLVAYYPLDGDALDLGGNRVDGHLEGADLAQDRSGSMAALYFDGSWDYIWFDNYPELEILGDLSISFWMNIADFGEGHSAIFTYQDWGEDPDANAIYNLSFPDGGNVLHYVHESGTGINHEVLFNDFTFQLDQWYHVVLTRDSNAMMVALYVNGVSVSTGSFTSNPEDGSSATFGIGVNNGTYSDRGFLNGTLDEFYIFGKVLTLEEVQDLYNME